MDEFLWAKVEAGIPAGGDGDNRQRSRASFSPLKASSRAHPGKDLNLQGQIQVKTEEPTHWFGRRQHRNIALLLRRRLGVLVCDTMVDFEQW